MSIDDEVDEEQSADNRAAGTLEPGIVHQKHYLEPKQLI